MDKTMYLSFVMISCSAVGKDGIFGDESDCQESVSMINQSGTPDLVVENAIHPDADWSEYGGTNGQGGDYKIEAWDCIDDSWWAPVEQQKVIQLTQIVDGCAAGDPELFLYPCGHQEGIDAPYRDYDQDGVMLIEGDCDDFDPDIGLALLCDQEFSSDSDTGESEDDTAQEVEEQD